MFFCCCGELVNEISKKKFYTNKTIPRFSFVDKCAFWFKFTTISLKRRSHSNKSKLHKKYEEEVRFYWIQEKWLWMSERGYRCSVWREKSILGASVTSLCSSLTRSCETRRLKWKLLTWYSMNSHSRIYLVENDYIKNDQILSTILPKKWFVRIENLLYNFNYPFTDR